ncbi:MAG: PorV/PorQ family protein [Candidatus Marinimicrobia bacterium]|nr:PorV/PorQ family protein [Candidatus Neomarinimicrobiota bacterium]
MNYRTMRVRALFTLIFATLVSGQNPNLGSAAAQFLKIPVGARSAALGGAMTGMSTDATALFWNPAGIAQDHSHSVHFSQVPWMTYFNLTAVGYTLNLHDLGTLGFHAVGLGMEKMEITTELQPDGTGQFFDSQDIVIGASYARKLTDRFSMGFTTKYVYQRIWNETASGIAFDVGTHYSIDFLNTAIAMSMRNFGADLQFEGPDLLIVHDDNDLFPNRLLQASKQTEKYPLPLSFQFGLSSDLIHSTFFNARLGIDAVHLNDENEQIRIGLEGSVVQRFFLRGGYQFNNDVDAGSLGVGLQQRIDNTIIKLDYAYVLHKHLEDNRFLSLSLVF